MTNTYSYNVSMSCGGCASSIKKTLNGIPGVKQVDTSVEQQSVTVVTDDNMAFEAISQAIRSTGKELKGGEVIATGEANNRDLDGQ